MKAAPLVVLLGLLIALAACGDQETSEVIATNRDPGIVNLDEAIRQHPDDADLYARRATMWYDKNNYDAAIDDYRQAVTLDSTNVEYYWDLADIYLDYYRSRLALRTLEQAATIAPDNLETQLRLAETRIILKQYNAAIGSLNEAIRLDPRNPDAYLLLSDAFLAQQDTARAIKAAEEATEIDPDLTDAYLILGRLLFAKGLPRADQYFDAAMAIDPADPVPIHAKADYLRDSDRLAEAIELYRGASRADRQYVAGHYNAGLLLMELDSVTAARREFGLAIKNDPTHVRAYFFRGYAREISADPAGARSDYETALRFDPDYLLAQEGLDRLGDN